MATKSLSSLVGNQATRQLELPNIDGTVHAAGTRGMIGKNILTNEWGFQPLYNKGLLKTYQTGDIVNYWTPGSQTQYDVTSPAGGPIATFIAPNGDCLVAAYLQPESWNSTSASSRDLRVYAFDATTGALVDTFIPSASSNLGFNTGNELNDSEMQIWNPITDFYVVQVKHHITTARLIMHGFNYNTSTQTLSTGSLSSSKTMTSGLSKSKVGYHYALNNAGTALHVLHFDSGDGCEMASYAIAGTAGAYTIGTRSFKDDVCVDGFGGMHWKMGGQSHMHRLSNDDIIFFGNAEGSVSTSTSYINSADYWINIWDSDGTAITQSYYLQDEAPASTDTNKFYWHQCLYSFEIATDEYILLSRSASSTSATHGPTDFWSNGDPYNVRATKAVVDPLDNTITQTDLGDFTLDELPGLMFERIGASDVKENSSIYDIHMDVANKRIIYQTKMYTVLLQFASDWTTDKPNCRSVYCPIGPKQLQQTADVGSTGLYGTNENQDFFHINNKIRTEHTYAVDWTNMKLWMPMYLTFNSISNAYAGVPAMAVYDLIQNAASSLEVVAASATADTVQCIADFDCFDNYGVPIGTQIGNTFAITADQVISEAPGRHVLDILMDGRSCNDQSDVDNYFHQIPPDRPLYQGGNTVPLRVTLTEMTDTIQFASGAFQDDQAVGFLYEDMDATLQAKYEGPMLEWTNLTTDLWVWVLNTNNVDYGQIIVVSEGWWVCGSITAVQTSSTSTTWKQGFQLKPSSRIVMHGRSAGGEIAMYEFRDTNKERWA